MDKRTLAEGYMKRALIYRGCLAVVSSRLFRLRFLIAFFFTGMVKPSIKKKLILPSVNEQLSDDNPQSEIDFETDDLPPTSELFTPGSSSTLTASSSCNSLTLQSPIAPSEREELYYEMNKLREDNRKLKAENFKLNFGENGGLTIQAIRANPQKCILVIGLSIDIFEKLLNYICQGTKEDLRTTRNSMENQIIFTFVKLKHNISFDMLSFITNTPKTTVIDQFWKWIDIMYMRLKFLIKVADRDNIYQTIPKVFKLKFPRLTSIIDCFETFVESPSSLMARAQFYSQYKKHCTIKVLISCTPLGAINFISKCYGGRASDVQITRESGFTTLRYHCPGDQILADRGFTLHDDFAAGSSTELLTPAFTKDKDQLSAHEVEISRKIASVRIHIERVIGLMKNRYTILKGIIPLRTVKSIKDEAVSSALANCDKIVTVCAALTNLGDSIVFR